MALVTLCPDCGTTYKIYPEQLQVKNGLVRCGKCQVIFNGFSTLITIDESEIEYLSVSADPGGVLGETSEHQEITGRSAGLRIVANEQLMQASATNIFENKPETPVEQTEASAADVASALENCSENTDLDRSASDFLSDAVSESSSRYRFWKAGNLVLFFLLIGQAVITYRADLATELPQTRPYLEQFCKILSCSVPLPADIHLLSIVSSDLQVNDPENQPDMATLTAIIRNHAKRPQALPALKLLLTDVHDQLLASRIFTSADYLPPDMRKKISILPNHEITVRLYMDNSQIKPTGYRLQILYI
ncbi:zinc-ribbon and DUF3426 domain-containing protein [Nitrosomonas marina]|uniref:MJ0042 family finger-like domain-containing protein n=1 Tax=Nitrosomonas marina TaxID=917 RepID=A0A1H8EF42_9PROT|nr:zinc-ribbon and DUF3426 domain-containing protein [Nitrosomonas marina]SEN18000.1 MJ0042 family finger-like domain-containing protein [Nitrosomonas marina]